MLKKIIFVVFMVIAIVPHSYAVDYTISVSTTIANRIGDAFEGVYPNPLGLTRPQLVKRKIEDYIKSVIKAYEISVITGNAQTQGKQKDLEVESQVTFQ